MKKLLTILIIIFINIFQLNTTNALSESYQLQIDSIYEIFTTKIEKKYTIKEEIKKLSTLDTKLKKVLDISSLSTKNKEILNYLYEINKEKLEKLQLKNFYVNSSEDTEKNNEKIFTSELKKNSNYDIDNYKISEEIKNILYNTDKIFLENGVWYYYKIQSYNYFQNPEKITTRDLKFNGIDPDNTVIFLTDSNVLSFAKTFEKIKLINDDIIYGIVNKYNFLLEIKGDKKHIDSDYDYDMYFKNLKEITIDLTSGLSEDEKIQIIYNYILDNASYSKVINFENKEIFSGIELFKNKEGICEGYVKLFMYMLNFAGISDTEIIRGYVIDASDFPDIGHAWVKIGDKYYDPTFDDPLGVLKTKVFEEYKYYNLPYDIFYANRFDYLELPDQIKSASDSYRDEYIEKKLYNLASKYEDYDYILLKKSKFIIKYNIGINEKITLSNLDKILPKYTVKDNKFTKNGKEYFISKLFYYTLTNDMLDDLLKQLNYDIESYYFFKRYNDNGTFEYRLGYNLELD